MTDAPKRIWAAPYEDEVGWLMELIHEDAHTDDDLEYILASEHAALIREAEARGMERAAKILDKRIESLVADHGSHEWDTNVTNLPEWVETATEELEAQAASIRAAKATP